jgi:hypothetical protein
MASCVCGFTPSSAGDHDDRDVGDARAAGAHGGERLVARGVEEGDRLAALVDLVGADVLGDATGLAGDDLGLADRVEQRRLAVVDVAHDRDDRRALDEVGRRRRRASSSLVLLGDGDDLDLLVELVGEQLDRLVGERLRERRHLAQAHELLDDLGDRDAEVLGDVLDRRAGGDPDEVGRLLGGAVDRGERLGLEVATATATAATTAARAALLALRGPPGPPGPPPGPVRRAACESMTTRRRPPGPAEPGAPERSPMRLSRVGRGPFAPGPPAPPAPPAPPGPPCWPGAGRGPRWPGAFCCSLGPRDAAPGALGRRAGAERAHRAGARSGGRRRLAVARTVLRGLDLLAGERVLGLLLVDRGGHGLDGDAGSLELREHVPRGHARLLGEFVDALLGHWVFSLSGSWLLTAARKARAQARAASHAHAQSSLADVGPRRSGGRDRGPRVRHVRAKRRSAAWSVTRPQPTHVAVASGSPSGPRRLGLRDVTSFLGARRRCGAEVGGSGDRRGGLPAAVVAGTVGVRRRRRPPRRAAPPLSSARGPSRSR